MPCPCPILTVMHSTESRYLFFFALHGLITATDQSSELLVHTYEYSSPVSALFFLSSPPPRPRRPQSKSFPAPAPNRPIATLHCAMCFPRRPPLGGTSSILALCGAVSSWLPPCMYPQLATTFESNRLLYVACSLAACPTAVDYLARSHCITPPA